MYLFPVVYYFLYIILFFGIIPITSLPILHLLGLGTIFTIFYLYGRLKKGLLKFITTIFFNSLFFILLKEFARVSYIVTITSILITTLILILYNLKRFKIATALLTLLLLFSGWQGFSIKYTPSNIEQNDYSNLTLFEYGKNQSNREYVDSSIYYNGNSGLAAIYDRFYWGFSTNLPLIGRVIYNNKFNKMPVIIVVHGNALAENDSYTGYDYLLKEFANNGFVAISISEEFLNGNWTTLGLGMPWENDARGMMILEHIEYLKKLNKDKSSSLYNKIDFENIGLVGHSRGGEAVAIAAKYSNGSVKAVMSLSGTDRQFKSDIYLDDISYIALHGANDGDLRNFKARSQYNRVNFSKPANLNSKDFNFKATYYLGGVNHAQFNTNWGKIDSTSLGKIYFGANSNIGARDQRYIAEKLGIAFFRLKLKGDKSQLKYIKSPLSLTNFPQIELLTNYNDTSMFKLTTNPVATNGTISETYIYGGKSISLSFKNRGSIKFNSDKKSSSSVTFSLANTLPSNIDADLFINFKNGITKVRKLNLSRSIERNIYKIELEESYEPTFQFYEIENIENWESIELKFNVTKLNLNREVEVYIKDFSNN